MTRLSSRRNYTAQWASVKHDYVGKGRLHNSSKDTLKTFINVLLDTDNDQCTHMCCCYCQMCWQRRALALGNYSMLAVLLCTLWTWCVTIYWQRHLLHPHEPNRKKNTHRDVYVEAPTGLVILKTSMALLTPGGRPVRVPKCTQQCSQFSSK